MSHEAARAQIMTSWQTAWTAAALAYPVEHDNQPFTRPDKAPWCRLTLLPGETVPKAIGTAGGERTVFVLSLQVFLPDDEGTLPAYKAADAMRRLNRVQAKNQAGTAIVNIQTASIADAGKFSQIRQFNVTIAGHYDTP
jgi:hypothetical protein